MSGVPSIHVASSRSQSSRTAHARAVCFLLALMVCAACADSSSTGTLVSFQSVKKSKAPWRVSDAFADADMDAALEASLDGGEARDAAEAGVDAGTVEDEDGGESEEHDAGTPMAKPISACTFKITTKSQSGRYAPKNIGAIWIERDNGEWVKTLKVWAGVRSRYLSTYLKTNTTRNTMDAVTSATLRQHGSHEAKWNLSDATGKPVPDGKYRLRVEVTDRDAMGQLLSLPFTRSSEAFEVTADDSDFFADVSFTCS